MLINVRGRRVFFLNFSNSEFYGGLSKAAEMILDKLLQPCGWPPLRSDDIYVFRNEYDATPRYLTLTAAEFISLSSGHNRPFQFAYQFSHELGHLMSQAWRRHGKSSYHNWIEEAICGAYSLHCMRHLEAKGDQQMRDGARLYLNGIASKYPVANIDNAWFVSNKAHLTAAQSLTDIIKPISRMIADHFSAGEFISDNIALADVPANGDLNAYLDSWDSKCGRSTSLPALLKSRLF